MKESIEKKFPFLKDRVVVQRETRLWLTVELKHFREVLDYLFNTLNFKVLHTITGLDEGENLGFIYHLSADNKLVLNLKTSAAKDKESIKTVTSYFPGSAIYERELVDLFGAKIEGVPPGLRYPLPDDWPKGQYPLRKDWKDEEKKNA